MITLEQAWERLLGPCEALAAEIVPVAQAGGRWLREPLAARRTQPWADLSAMDGYATCGPGPWALVGKSRAGESHGRSLIAGEAVAISTGAALPAGADAIVPVEDARVAEGRLTAEAPPEPGRHIRRKGLDFAAGDPLIAAGTRLTAPRIALALAAGYGTVAVGRRPRVTIIECGDELHADPAACPPDGLPASNGAMLAWMVESEGAIPNRPAPVPDRLEALAAAMDAAQDADLLVTSGGASVGDHDWVGRALEYLGFELDFWRVAIRPGKPLIVARRGRQLMLGLPGNPVSSYVTGLLFALPALRAMAGAAECLPRPVLLPLDGDLPSGGTRREFRRAVLGPDGVRPIATRDSSALAALARADLLIDRAVDAPPVKAGYAVPCYWLENDRNA